jgi:hypothetical protein
VQVTLQIFAALIEKAPRDLHLYAPYVLRVLDLILKSGDITMVEASIPTFDAFCEHHDGASLSADQEYLQQYEETVRLYASFASTRSQASKVTPSAPVAMRWRVAGLQAIKSVVSSDSLASVAGRQLDVLMPVLLENLWTDSHDYLDILQQRVHMEEKVDSEKLLRRRTSIATVRTVETGPDHTDLALSGTTADADKLAEEDIGVLAVQCVKQIFIVNNRSQIRTATFATLRFIDERVAQKEVVTEWSSTAGQDRGWATTIFMMIARWTPVQDRYVILVTAMETLVKSPLAEDNLPQQFVLATMVGSLLRSDINLIGLSVMDVLLGLIQHVLRILQLGGSAAHSQQREAVGDEQTSDDTSPASSAIGTAITETVNSPSILRKQLLAQLQQCIGDLATHVYYADQISDMIAAILLRLKPSPNSIIATPAAAIEDPQAATNVVTASASLVEDPATDGFFSFATAKITALKAIKAILLVANRKGKASTGGNLGRNRVGLRVWEGTQWLLRDSDGQVRLAYVDALLTWLGREMVKSDLKAFEEKHHHSSSKGLVRNAGDDSSTSLSKRAVSNASHREKIPRTSRTMFLQLLHLAIYENALQYVEFEADIALLHLLLTTLVDKLGVNAVKNGLPMIFRLQEDIQEAETMAKVRMGSLCHGYFWALSEKFDFESSAVGRELQNEIRRRSDKGFWVDMVRLPPVPLDSLGMPGVPTKQKLPMHELESESLLPFDDQITMVELISVAYSESMVSPPSSPPTSPGRSFSHPILNNSPTEPAEVQTMPAQAREQMLSEWTREAILTLAQESSKTASLNGSRTGTAATGQGRPFLAVNGNLNGGTQSGTQSPGSHGHRSRPPSQVHGVIGGFGTIQKLRKGSGPGASLNPPSDSSHNSVTRLEQLKRVLSGQAPPSRGIGAHSDASSESMVSFEGTPSEASYDVRVAQAVTIGRRVSADTARSKSRDRGTASGEYQRALGSHPVALSGDNTLSEADEDSENLESVPPVPPIPTGLSLPGTYPDSSERVPKLATVIQDYGNPNIAKGASRGLKSRGEASFKRNSWEDVPIPKVDLESLLLGIESANGNGNGNGNAVLGGNPPY